MFAQSAWACGRRGVFSAPGHLTTGAAEDLCAFNPLRQEEAFMVICICSLPLPSCGTQFCGSGLWLKLRSL